MTLPRLLLVASLAAIALAPAAPAGAPPVAVPVVAGPAAVFLNYATPVVAVPVGGLLDFHNLDILLHNVVSEESGPETQPWCGEYPLGMCPVLHSPLVDLGVTVPVLGTESLEEGRLYTFYCTLHSSMRGVLLALPEA